MAFAIYLHRDTFQPESPLILDKSTADCNVNFTFVDFVPSVIKRPTTVIPQCEVEYHPFSAIVKVANEWLSKNGHLWQVVNCETVIFLYKYNDSTSCYELRPDDCCFYIYGSEKNNVLKALRLWIRKISQPNPKLEHQVLMFQNILPQNRHDGVGRFDDLDKLLAEFNEEMKTKGLNGKILTVESLPYEATKDWKIDTETSLSTFSNKNVFNVRIFYEKSDTLTFPQIGIEDFFPNQITRATFFKKPTFETFDKVIERGFSWLQQNPLKRFINAQSIDIKMKSPSSVNSRQMSFTEHGDYMRIFRIAYINTDHECHVPPVALCSKIFLPYRKTDTMADIKQRLSEWINQYLERYKTSHANQIKSNDISLNYPSVLSAETVEVFAKEFRNDNIQCTEKAANNDTFNVNRFGNKNAYMFFSLRIFFDDFTLDLKSLDTCTPNTV